MDALMQVFVPVGLLAFLIVGSKSMIVFVAVIHGKHIRKVRRQG